MENRIREYWNNSPCNSGWGAPFKEGTLGWFKNIEDKREWAYPHIRDFARYEDWRDKKVLEIGCGVGCDTVLFAKAGAIITAVDLSLRSVELTLKHLWVYELYEKVICINAEELPFDNSFDLVYSWGVIHHSPNPAKLFNEIYRVMKAGATFKAMLYHRYSLGGLMNCFKDNESPGTKTFTYGEIRKMLRKFDKVNITPTLMAEEDIIRNSPKLPGWSLRFYPKRLSSWCLVEAIK